MFFFVFLLRPSLAYLYLAVPQDMIVDFVTFLQFLNDDPFLEVRLFLEHHLMQIWIKFSCGLDWSHAGLPEEVLELTINHLHPSGKLCAFFAFLEALLKAVDDGQQLSDELLLSI